MATALATAAGALQLQLAGLPPEEPLRSALELFGRALVVCWLAVTAASGLVRVIGKPIGAPTSDAGRIRARGLVSPPWLVFIAGAIVVMVLTVDAPWRLTSNLLGLTAVGVPLIWLAGRHAGEIGATDAALAFCTFAVVPSMLDIPRPQSTVYWEPASPYRWSVALPAPEWSLAHEVRLDRPLDETTVELVVWIAREPAGSAALVASLNGHPLGPLVKGEDDTRVGAIPRQLSAGQTVLRFEIAATAVDPTLRILAHRWPSGATAGREASSYFDGMRWSPGTFNDAIGRPQPGAYVITLRGAAR